MNGKVILDAVETALRIAKAPSDVPTWAKNALVLAYMGGQADQAKGYAQLPPDGAILGAMAAAQRDMDILALTKLTVAAQE